jgi:hypothetical protein
MGDGIEIQKDITHCRPRNGLKRDRKTPGDWHHSMARGTSERAGCPNAYVRCDVAIRSAIRDQILNDISKQSWSAGSRRVEDHLSWKAGPIL